MLRKVILNLHLYGGLLCFGYLIIFGISSLNFNHPYEFTKSRGEATTWEREVQLPDLPRLTPDIKGEDRVKTKARANHQVREALGLFGHQRPWAQSYWNDKNPNHYHASLVRPGRDYEVDVYLDQNKAVVKEIPGNPFMVMKGLHGFHGNMPGSSIVSTWGWYTEFCTLFVVFAGATGVYLWTRRRNELRIGLILLGSATAFSMAFLIYVTIHG